MALLELVLGSQLAGGSQSAAEHLTPVSPNEKDVAKLELSAAAKADSFVNQIEASPLLQGSAIFIIVLSARSIGAKTYDVPHFPLRLCLF